MTNRGSRHWNLILGMIALTVVAVWGARSQDQKPQGERYFAGNRFNGVFLEIHDDQYRETYRSALDDTERVVSEGLCIREVESLDLTLIDSHTGVERRLKRDKDELFYSGDDCFRIYVKADHDRGRLLFTGESPYAVDGVRIGFTLDQVKATWGELESDPEDKREFRAADGVERSVEIDEWGRVYSIWGSELTRGKTVLLSTDYRFEAASKVGEKRVFSDWCGGGGPYSVRTTQRVLGDYELLVLGMNEDVIRDQEPEIYRKMIAESHDFGNVEGFSLTLGRLWPGNLPEASDLR